MLAACASSPILPGPAVYPRTDDHVPVRKSAVVLPFADGRQEGDERGSPLAFFPFVPYATDVLARPERWPHSGYSPLVDFPRALAGHLRRAAVFSSVQFAAKREEAEPGADLLVEGAVISSRRERTLYTYGLSLFGSVLWVLGAPIRRTTLVLEVSIRIVDARSGAVLWEADVADRAASHQGMIWRAPEPRFPDLAGRMIYEAILDIDAAAAEGDFGG